VAIDDVLQWVADGNYADDRVGRALKRVMRFGTLEQSIAFTTALREQLRGLSSQQAARGRVDLLALNPLEFEQLVHTLFLEMGFAEWDMRSRRDDGVDAIALRKGATDGEVYLVQAKRFRRAVAAETVRALAGSVKARNAAGGIIVTTSWFGRVSYEFAESVGNLDLIDGRRLCDLLERHLGVKAVAAPPE
jgi:HJR/Mrr/RecB family endonuclease